LICSFLLQEAGTGEEGEEGEGREEEDSNTNRI